MSSICMAYLIGITRYIAPDSNMSMIRIGTAWRTVSLRKRFAKAASCVIRARVEIGRLGPTHSLRGVLWTF